MNLQKNSETESLIIVMNYNAVERLYTDLLKIKEIDSIPTSNRSRYFLSYEIYIKKPIQAGAVCPQGWV